MSACTLFTALLIAAPAVKDKAKPAEAPPTGEWVAEKFEQGGNDLLKIIGSLTMTFRDGTVAMRVGGMDHEVGATFDPTAQVKEINITPKSPAPGPIAGIYKIEGDTLTICVNEKPDTPRPTEFKSDTPNLTFLVLKRVQK